jgi:AcrR family transcriptional regulator
MQRQKTTKKHAKSQKSRSNEKQSFIEKARRAQIIDTAARLFVDQGFANTSMEDIAQSLGVSRGVLFYYFDGKTALGDEALRIGVRSYVDYVQSRVTRKRSAKAKLQEYTDACLDYQADHPQLYISFVELLGCLGENEEKYRLTKSLNQRTRRQLIEIINQGIEAGEFARVDARTLADILQTFIDGMMAMTAMEPGTVDIGKTKRLWRRMLDGVLS